MWLGSEAFSVNSRRQALRPGEHLKRRAELGLKEWMQELPALRFRIVLEQDRGGAAAADRADAFEQFPRGGAVEADHLR